MVSAFTALPYTVHSGEYSIVNGYYVPCLCSMRLQCLIAVRASLLLSPEYNSHFILLNVEISDSEIMDILKKIGIDCDISPITKIILENDRKLGKIFMRIK